MCYASSMIDPEQVLFDSPHFPATRGELETWLCDIAERIAPEYLPTSRPSNGPVADALIALICGFAAMACKDEPYLHAHQMVGSAIKAIADESAAIADGRPLTPP